MEIRPNQFGSLHIIGHQLPDGTVRVQFDKPTTIKLWEREKMPRHRLPPTTVQVLADGRLLINGVLFSPNFLGSLIPEEADVVLGPFWVRLSPPPLFGDGAPTLEITTQDPGLAAPGPVYEGLNLEDFGTAGTIGASDEDDQC